jgi:hypothetical protein
VEDFHPYSVLPDGSAIENVSYFLNIQHGERLLVRGRNLRENIKQMLQHILTSLEIENMYQYTLLEH